MFGSRRHVGKYHSGLQGQDMLAEDYTASGSFISVGLLFPIFTHQAVRQYSLTATNKSASVLAKEDLEVHVGVFSAYMQILSV